MPASTQTLSPEGTGDKVAVVEVGAGVGDAVVALPDVVVPSGVEDSGMAVLLGVAVSNGLALWHSSVGHLGTRASPLIFIFHKLIKLCAHPKPMQMSAQPLKVSCWPQPSFPSSSSMQSWVANSAVCGPIPHLMIT